MTEIFIVGMGGFIGTCFRYIVTKFMNHFTISLPFGTLISNIIAGLLIGFIIGLEQSSFLATPKTKLFLTTGLCGGLSTFSTFSLETVILFQNEKYVVAILNILLNIGISMLGVIAGMAFAKLLFKQLS
ncbi:MAG: fluoride efflux transporter CrcB [Lachnospiraceae bacterium]